MDNSYKELKSITDKYYTDGQMPPKGIFVDLLNRHGINLRNKDGVLQETTVSVPKSRKDALVLGVRYKKNDETFSEDLFLFQKGQSIQRGYKGRLEKILPEYTGTHREQPSA